MLENNFSTLDCKKEVCEEYNKKVDEEHEKLVWSNELVDSWYRNREGRVVALSPWRLVDYWKMTNRPNMQDFNCE